MQLSLLSPRFLGLSLIAVLVLPVLNGGARQIAFIAINLAFLAGVLLGPSSALAVLIFALLGFGLAQVAAGRNRTRLILALVLYVALFVYLQRYDFLQWILPDAALPRFLSTIGLSFLFFKIIHVIVDAYGGALGPLGFITYLNYCLNFATFAMGPIQRFPDYRSQWERTQVVMPERFEPYLDAVLRFVMGLTKVYVLAPVIEPLALRPDTNLHDLSLAGFVIQSYAFWIYLFLNFSGYCDVVIAIGSLFGVRPPENFDKPYLARNISDFWLRQHRSLTLWLTDYIFTPAYKKSLSTSWLSRHKLLAVNLCLMLTMLISGLWHGTTISFVFFGLAHGIWFVVYRTWDTWLQHRLGRPAVQRLRSHWLAHAAGVFLTFNVTAFTFVFFRLDPHTLLNALRGVSA